MRCPHCSIDFHDIEMLNYIGNDNEGHWGYQLYQCSSPSCRKFIIFLIRAEFRHDLNTRQVHLRNDKDGNPLIFFKQLIKPIGINRSPVPPQVPAVIAQDFKEACLVFPFSAKASAALSRRCLQNLLRTLDYVKHGDLHDEIQQVLDSNTLPSMLSDSIDAIRQIGNFAAHPKKSISTGEIVDVEPGEAEWNLDILESLFDYYFVLPDVLQKKKDALNSKLGDIGKPKMK